MPLIGRVSSVLYNTTHGLDLAMIGMGAGIAVVKPLPIVIALASLLGLVVLYYEARVGMLAGALGIARFRRLWYSIIIDVLYHIGLLGIALAVYEVINTGLWLVITGIVQVVTWLAWLAVGGVVMPRESWLVP